MPTTRAAAKSPANFAQDLDRDLLRTLFALLDGRSLQHALQTCKNWASMAKDDGLWKARVEREWPELCGSAPAPGLASSVSVHRARYLTLWRAENISTLSADAAPNLFALTELNSQYEFVVHVKDSSGEILASGSGPVELTSGEGRAGDAMGGGEFEVDNTLHFTAAFHPHPLCLPSSLLADSRNGENMVHVNLSVQVRRRSDAKVSPFLTCTIDHYCFQGDGFEYGFLTGVGIGSVVRRGYGSNQRRPLPWVGLIKHALPYAPADGHMEGELSAEFNEDGLAEDLDEIPPFDKIRLKFEKRACLGDGPWAPAFTTPLTLADMPDILASLTWA